MFIEANAEITFTHDHPHTGQPVEDRKGTVKVRIDLGDLHKLLQSLIELAADGRGVQRPRTDHVFGEGADTNGREQPSGL